MLDAVSLGFIAVALAMDAFAVSVSCGLSAEGVRKRYAFRIASAFGLFQAFMPVAGWILGGLFLEWIVRLDHWIALGLLGFIGGKMLWEARETCRENTDFMSWRMLFLMSLATSIDAFAVGLTFAMLDVEILAPVILIGIVTFGMSWAGVFLGGRFGCYLGNKMERIGGLLLIGIGLKICVEHIIQGK